MKHALACSLMALLLLLVSCEKKYCWQCTTTMGNPENHSVLRTDELCDQTEQDITSYQLVNSHISIVNEDSVVYTNTTCQKR